MLTYQHFCQVIMNPQTTQSYEEMLADIGAMLEIGQPPIESLWTARKPYKKVRGGERLNIIIIIWADQIG